jgi:glutamine cyclotransferase
MLWRITLSIIAAAIAYRIWTQLDGAAIQRIERSEREPPGSVSGISFDGRSLWLTIENDGLLLQTDPETGEIARKVTLTSTRTGGSVFDGEYLWQVFWEARKIVQLELPEGKIVGELPAPGKGYIAGIAFDGENLIVGNWEDRLIYKIDRKGTVVRTYEGHYETTGLVWDGRRLWTGILVGTQTHDEATPELAFVQRWDPDRDLVDLVLPVPGVAPGGSNWIPGREEPADRFWWYDGHHKRLVEIRLKEPNAFYLGILSALLFVLVLGAIWVPRSKGGAR